MCKILALFLIILMPTTLSAHGRTFLQPRPLVFIHVTAIDTYFAIADEAKKENIPFAGHLPESVSAAEASDAGQRSVEHVGGGLYIIASSDREAELRKKLSETVSGAPNLAAFLHAFFPILEEALDSYSEQKAAELFSKFARNGTWQVPTLSVLQQDEGVETNDPRMKSIPLFIREYCSRHPYITLRKKVFQKHLEIVGAMNRAGVKVLAGSDSGNPYVYPGSGLHDELALLVRAGLTPMEALQAATLNPAKFLNLLETLGTVERGKLADLVLLEANPLDDISNTRRIAAVVVNGMYLPKSELQKMLAGVEAATHKK
jgi:hypothetical protein